MALIEKRLGDNGEIKTFDKVEIAVQRIQDMYNLNIESNRIGGGGFPCGCPSLEAKTQ